MSLVIANIVFIISANTAFHVYFNRKMQGIHDKITNINDIMEGILGDIRETREIIRSR